MMFASWMSDQSSTGAAALANARSSRRDMRRLGSWRCRHMYEQQGGEVSRSRVLLGSWAWGRFPCLKAAGQWVGSKGFRGLR